MTLSPLAGKPAPQSILTNIPRLVSSSMIDRIAQASGRKLVEVPVGFKWFVDGLLDGSLGFGGEESAGASFLRHNGTVWTTDKDGIILNLLAAEITAKTGRALVNTIGNLPKNSAPPFTNVSMHQPTRRKKPY